MRVFQQDRPSDGRDRKRSQRFAGLIVMLALLAAAAWSWSLLRQEQILGWRLAQARQHAETSEHEIDSLVHTIGQERVKLVQARQTAAEAAKETASSAAAREQAETEQRAAAEQAEQSRQQAEQARAEAEHAEEEKKQIRAERGAELARMQQAMGHIVKTTPAPWGMTIDLGRPEALFHDATATLDQPGREILSRVAGAFLASHGYRISLRLRDPGEDPKTSDLLEKRLNAVHDYLLKAGLPPEIISMSVSGKESAQAAGGWIEVRVVDTILPENRSRAESSGKAGDTSGRPAQPVSASGGPSTPASEAAGLAARHAAESEQQPSADAPGEARSPHARDRSAQDSQAGEWIIQVASVRDEGDARRIAGELESKGFPVSIDDTSKPGWYRVAVGAFPDQESAKRTQQQLEQDGYRTWLRGA